MLKKKSKAEFIVLILSVCLFGIGCVGFLITTACDGGKDKKSTTTNNNYYTTNEIQPDPEPVYMPNLASLDPEIIVSEVCYNSQVLYVFTKTITKDIIVGKGKGKHTETQVSQDVVGMVYHLDKQGRPIQCGEVE